MCKYIRLYYILLFILLYSHSKLKISLHVIARIIADASNVLHIGRGMSAGDYQPASLGENARAAVRAPTTSAIGA